MVKFITIAQLSSVLAFQGFFLTDNNNIDEYDAKGGWPIPAT